MSLDTTLQSSLAVRTTSNPAKLQRIVVAEDDEDASATIAAAMADDRYEVIVVEDDAQLFQCLDTIACESRRGPDLITMDVCMPGRSGIELLEAVRGRGWRTPVVLVTAFVSPDLRFRTRKAGSAAVIAKPFTADELRDAARCARTECPLPRNDS